MTTSNVLIINPSECFEDQARAVRGLLQLASDGVAAMDAGFNSEIAAAICNIHAAVSHWTDHNVKAELQRRSKPLRTAPERPKLVAAE